MKRLLFFCAGIVLSAAAIGQSKNDQLSTRVISESLVKINEQLYASKYEVSNKLYRIFLNSLRQENKGDLLAVARIDTLEWIEADTYNPPYAEHYH